MTTALATIKKTVNDELILEKLAGIATADFDTTALVKEAMLVIARKPELQKCTPMSICDALMDCARLGLRVGGTLEEAHLVPFGDKCTFIPGYRGLAELARRAEGVEIETVCVFDGDKFHEHRGTTPAIIHEPSIHDDRTDDAHITHCYAVATWPNGRMKFEIMTRAQIDKIRQSSKQPNGFLWKDHFHEACRKTVLRRLCKSLRLSTQALSAVERMDKAEVELPIIDGEARVVEQGAVDLDELQGAEPLGIRGKTEPEVSPSETEEVVAEGPNEYLSIIVSLITANVNDITDAGALAMANEFLAEHSVTPDMLSEPDVWADIWMKVGKEKWQDRAA